MRVTVVRGDITAAAVDAIVNAAHPSLLGGGGVDGAIHRKAGPKLREACMALPIIPRGEVGPQTLRILAGSDPDRQDVRCEVADVRVTPAFGLPVRHVIHTVGPLYDPSMPTTMRHLLAASVGQSLTYAGIRGCRSVALPAISCGVFGFPVRDAAETMRRVIEQGGPWEEDVEEIMLVMFDLEVFQVFHEVFAAIQVQGDAARAL